MKKNLNYRQIAQLLKDAAVRAAGENHPEMKDIAPLCIEAGLHELSIRKDAFAVYPTKRSNIGWLDSSLKPRFTQEEITEFIPHVMDKSVLGGLATFWDTDELIASLPLVDAVKVGFKADNASADDSIEANAIISNDAEETLALSSTYAVIKKITLSSNLISAKITLRLKFEYKSDTGNAIYAQIYKNGTAVGSEFNTAETSYVAISEDFSCEPSDLIEIKVKSADTETAYVRNFRVYGTQSMSTLPQIYNRITGYIDVSSQLIRLQNPKVAEWLINLLMAATAQKMEERIFSNEPRSSVAWQGMGYAATTGADTKANAVAVSESALVAMEAAVSENSSLNGPCAFITSDKGARRLKVTAVEGGQPERYLKDGKLFGYPLVHSNNVNDVAGADAGGSLLTFGNWKDLSILQAGPFFVTVDQYSFAQTNKTRITISSYWSIMGLRGSVPTDVEDATTDPYEYGKSFNSIALISS